MSTLTATDVKIKKMAIIVQCKPWTAGVKGAVNKHKAVHPFYDMH